MHRPKEAIMPSIKDAWCEVLAHRRVAVTGVSRNAQNHGITVIDGGCPCMFRPTADPAHKGHARRLHARWPRPPARPDQRLPERERRRRADGRAELTPDSRA
jgi:hypothetical protein